jgi:hypothetical protein
MEATISTLARRTLVLLSKEFAPEFHYNRAKLSSVIDAMSGNRLYVTKLLFTDV